MPKSPARGIWQLYGPPPRSYRFMLSPSDLFFIQYVYLWLDRTSVLQYFSLTSGVKIQVAVVTASIINKHTIYVYWPRNSNNCVQISDRTHINSQSSEISTYCTVEIVNLKVKKLEKQVCLNQWYISDCQLARRLIERIHTCLLYKISENSASTTVDSSCLMKVK
jgi:hypothetical protein